MSISREFAIGLTKVKENDFATAIIHFSNAIDEDASQVEYFAERAVAYIHMEEYDLSLFDMNKCIELDPDYSYRYSCRAFLKSKMGDIEGAILDYQKAIELDPDDAIAYNNLGLAQEQKGYRKESQKSFDKSNELIGYNPNRFDEADEQKEARKNQLKEDQPEIKASGRAIAGDVFTKKSTFKEFLSFIGNGFKLKENDKKGKE